MQPLPLPSNPELLSLIMTQTLPVEWGLLWSDNSLPASFCPIPPELADALPLPPLVTTVSAMNTPTSVPQHLRHYASHILFIALSGPLAVHLPSTTIHLPPEHFLTVPASHFATSSISSDPSPTSATYLRVALLHTNRLRKFLRSPSCAALSSALHRTVTAQLDQLHLLALHWVTCPTPSPSFTPQIGPLSFLSLNVRLSLQPKLRALAHLLRRLNFPTFIALQEVGNISPTTTIHPLYAAISSPSTRPALGVQLLYRQHASLRLGQHHVHPGGRAVAAEFHFGSHTFWILAVYLSPSGPAHLRV